MKALIQFDLISGDEFIGGVGHADDGLELFEHGVGHAFSEGGGGVGGNAVVAIVGDADGDVDEFFGEGVYGAGSHDGFEALPGALQKSGVMGDGLPEIIDPIGFAGGHDVVVDGANFGSGVLVFD